MEVAVGLELHLPVAQNTHIFSGTVCNNVETMIMNLRKVVFAWRGWGGYTQESFMESSSRWTPRSHCTELAGCLEP